MRFENRLQRYCGLRLGANSLPQIASQWATLSEIWTYRIFCERQLLSHPMNSSRMILVGISKRACGNSCVAGSA
jgi:hypothetical protein